MSNHNLVGSGVLFSFSLQNEADRSRFQGLREEKICNVSRRWFSVAVLAICFCVTLLSWSSQSWAQTGLVAAYTFNEGTGSTLTDISGNGNNGTISGASWTTSGKFGNALLFTGPNTKVTIPDAASLRLTTGMTLEAWVFPTVTPTGWQSVVVKN